jgi:hypothetical protein
MMVAFKENPAALAGADGAVIEAVGTALDSQNHTATDVSPQAKWNRENPLALWAHNAVRSAIRRGLIERKPCEVCGAEPADAHHDDYSRPLAIRWLCRLHHRELHSKRGGAA